MFEFSANLEAVHLSFVEYNAADQGEFSVAWFPTEIFLFESFPCVWTNQQQARNKPTHLGGVWSWCTKMCLVETAYNDVLYPYLCHLYMVPMLRYILAFVQA